MGYKIETTGVNFYVPHARITSILSMETSYKFEDVSLPEGGEDTNSDLFDANSISVDERYFVHNAIKSIISEVWDLVHRIQPLTQPGYFNKAIQIPNWRDSKMDPECYVESPISSVSGSSQVVDICSGFYTANRSSNNNSIYPTIDLKLEQILSSGILAKWYFTKNRGDDFKVQNTLFNTALTDLNNLLYRLYKYDIQQLTMTK